MKPYMIFLMLLLLCTACAHKHDGMLNNPGLETVPTSPDASLASFIGSGAEGESRIFDDTSFGTSVAATIDKPYISALGSSCRKAYITARSDKRLIAVCRGEDQQWYLAPDIFVPGAF